MLAKSLGSSNHANVVKAIESLHADRLNEHLERLADHAVRGEVWDKAVAYLRQAGAKAFDRSPSPKVVETFEKALQIDPGNPYVSDVAAVCHLFAADVVVAPR